MSIKAKVSEKGQSLVIVAVLMILLLGMLALAIDVGFVYMNRRAAQNAADAGALAGARQLCSGESAGVAYASAEEYACTRNQADPPPATIINVDAANKRVDVTASITRPSFAAQLFGQPDWTTPASASAGCFRPCYAQSVLPIAWSCRPPVDPSLSSSHDCQQQRITWDELQNYLATPNTVQPELYVVMDSLTYDSDIMCVQDLVGTPDPAYTYIDCDFDGDGEADFLSSGGRSWVDLDGSSAGDNCPGANGEGSSELDYWIANGYGCQLETHLWIAQQSGVTTSVFSEASRRQLVLIPVFDDACEGDDPAADCPGRVHAEDDFHEVNGSQMNFHIIDFAAFYITCARVNPGDRCPGQQRFAELNGPSGLGLFNNGALNSMRSIEGYFIEGLPPGLGGRCEGGVDTGIYTLYLDE